MQPLPEHHTRFEYEIRSWLQDDQQLAELGRRCVTAMLNHEPLPPVTPTTTQAELLRTVLVQDWLRDI